QAEDGIRDFHVTGVQTCALPISSSPLAFSASPLATFTSVSSPTTSAVRKVADLGCPIAGPVNLSTSATVRPSRSTRWVSASMEYTPTRLPIKAGVSLHKTVVLPRKD